MPVKKFFSLITLFITLATVGFCQAPFLYLFHPDLPGTPRGFEDPTTRVAKTSIDAGLVIPATSVKGTSVNYVKGFSAGLGYTFGVMEEIPIQRHAYLVVGVELLQSSLSFNSYYFAPGYSFLYDGSEIYNHSVTFDEIHVPILYKFRLGPVDRKLRSIYMTMGAKFRYISYTNSTIKSDSSGYLVWEGQKDITTLSHIFSPFGSAIFEISLGYQKNKPKRKRKGWYMNLEYNYGLTSLVYTGNNNGSNDITFKLNTIVFKIGKLF